MGNFDQVSLLLLVLVPLAGAALAMFLPKERPRDAWQFAIFVALVCFVLSVIVFLRYDYGDGAGPDGAGVRLDRAAG